ncbi:DUF190 domain-containing protein [uncultured Thermus sp.]|uniref:DUF190 domain-containing protein n=1 Tax=uncultured Thermus sp. TaxID=157149 RepID=UPI00341641A3
MGESGRHGGQPLHAASIQAATDGGPAGARAFKGFWGQGAHFRIHNAKTLQLSEDLPVMREMWS